MATLSGDNSTSRSVQVDGAFNSILARPPGRNAPTADAGNLKGAREGVEVVDASTFVIPTSGATFIPIPLGVASRTIKNPDIIYSSALGQFVAKVPGLYTLSLRLRVNNIETIQGLTIAPSILAQGQTSIAAEVAITEVQQIFFPGTGAITTPIITPFQFNFVFLMNKGDRVRAWVQNRSISNQATIGVFDGTLIRLSTLDQPTGGLVC